MTFRLPLFFLLFTASAIQSTHSQSPVTVALKTSAIGSSIQDDFIGLSFEMEKLLPDARGEYLFSPKNDALISLFKMLGVKSLRVGGNTADRPSVRLPDRPDIDNLFAFADAAGVKVIYTLRLREGDPKVAAQTATYIMNRYRPLLDCFAIGNEPNVFAREYASYRDEWKKYVDLITAPEHAPEATFCGPSSTPGQAAWCRDFAADFGRSGKIRFIAQHAYPGGSGTAVTDPASARQRMLARLWTKGYESFHASFVPAVQLVGLRYRIEETNNFYNGGAAEVSNTFASALWGLDYMHWWAQHSAAGLNFHTGDSVAAGERTNPCRYAVFTTSAVGYFVRPLGYAVKAFDLGSHGSVFPTGIVSNADSINLSAYGVISGDKILSLTLINKEHGFEARDAVVTILSDKPIVTAEVITLTSPNRDIGAVSGVRLGGAEIQHDAAWNGTWTRLSQSRTGEGLPLQLLAATAVIVRMKVK